MAGQSKSTAFVERRRLQIEEGRDYLLDENDELPYTLIKNLGHGHTANVEMVRDDSSGRVFARKVFRICSTRDERQAIFENEIKIIRQLAPNPHIIRVFATYVARREVGLILLPVANRGDLESFLQDFREANTRNEEEYLILGSSFACLANGLSFMHDQKIRHKDIKPRNILIHDRKIYYTDFGFSLDHSKAIGATTTGRPHAMTRKYCAPEVSEWEPRNSKSDVFSLGCVFFEILAAMIGISPLDRQSVYHEEIPNVQLLLTLHEPSFSSQVLKNAGKLASEMITREPHLRPSAQSIFEALRLETWAVYGWCSDCGVSQSLPDQPTTSKIPCVGNAAARSLPMKRRIWDVINRPIAARKKLKPLFATFKSPSECLDPQAVVIGGPSTHSRVIEQPSSTAYALPSDLLDYMQLLRGDHVPIVSASVSSAWDPGTGYKYREYHGNPTIHFSGTMGDKTSMLECGGVPSQAMPFWTENDGVRSVEYNTYRLLENNGFRSLEKNRFRSLGTIVTRHRRPIQ